MPPAGSNSVWEESFHGASQVVTARRQGRLGKATRRRGYTLHDCLTSVLSPGETLLKGYISKVCHPKNRWLSCIERRLLIELSTMRSCPSRHVQTAGIQILDADND